MVFPANIPRRGLLLFLLPLLDWVGPLAAQPAAKNVLLVNSYHQGFEWTDHQTRAITEALSKEFPGIEVWIEYMDSRRLDERTRTRATTELLRAKYSAVHLDLILVTDDAALKLVHAAAPALFPSVPVVFCGVSDKEEIARLDRRRYTGIEETFNTTALVDMALGVWPQARRIAFVVDASVNGAAFERLFRTEMARRSGVEAVYLRGAELGLEEVLRRLRGLDEQTVVIAPAYTADRDGQAVPLAAGMGALAAAAQAPMLSPNISELGQGVLAGSANGGLLHGRAAARVAIRLLRGERPENLAIKPEGEFSPVFDSRQMARWGIPRSRVPAGAEIVNGEQSWWEQQRGVIVTFGSFILLEAVIISLLVVNILGRRRAEARALGQAKLAQQRERDIRLLTDSLNEMVLVYDMNRQLLYANPAFEKLTGYSVDELRARGFVCWIHSADQERMILHWDRLFQGQSYAEQEYRMIAKDGAEKWSSASWGPIWDESGRQVGVRGVERDITGRVRAEAALREVEERFRLVFEMAPDGIFIAGENAEFLAVNEAACRQLGYSREALLRRSVYDIVPARQVEGVRARLPGLTGAGASYRSCHVRSDGTEFPVELNVRRFQLGGQTALVGIARDVSERERGELERARLEEQLRQAQKLESIGRLAGGVAHDFNNLLTVINGYGDLLLQRLRGDDPARGPLTQIRKAGERAAELTQQLLAFSRKQIAEPRPVDVNEQIADTRDMLQRLLGEDIMLVTSLAAASARVMADPGQLHQVLMNLAVNARDAMAAGGRLELTTANVELEEASADAMAGTAPGRYVELSVTDNGSGMDEETQRQIFEPFFTTKARGEGTGLGLSTVYGIVKQSGGWVGVRSTPGQGTTFRILLPVTEAPAAGEAGAGEPAIAAGGSETVLVVEDQQETRNLVASVLKELGYQVLEAGDGASALSLAQSHTGPIHLLLTDVVMPGMSGGELAERLKTLRPEAKVLYTSGYTGGIVLRRGIGEPDIAFLPKPFTPGELAAKVRGALG
jgi:PAS domain S-box-containing protein